MTDKITDQENATIEQLLGEVAEANERVMAAMRADKRSSTYLTRHEYRICLLSHQDLAIKIVNHMQALWNAGYRLRKDGD